jgi:hypothetical protein
MIGIAYAMGAGGQGGTAPGGEYHFIILMAAIFAIFYFLLIRPQQKRQKAVKDMLGSLGHGDMVVTVGGSTVGHRASPTPLKPWRSRTRSREGFENIHIANGHPEGTEGN